MIRHPPRSTLFPSTPLFRSFQEAAPGGQHERAAPDLTAGLQLLAEHRQEELGDALRSIEGQADRKSTRLNSSHANISYAVFCLKKKKKNTLTASSTMRTSIP